MTDNLRKKVNRFFHKRTNVTNIIDIVGCILIGIGVFLFSIPIGFIFSGLAFLAISFTITKNGELDELYSESQ